MGLTINVGEVRRNFEAVQEKYGYGENDILKALSNSRVWSQDLDYRFAYDLFNGMYECCEDTRLKDEDQYNLISGGLTAHANYYKSENMIFKRMLDYIGILRVEDYNINTDYFYELNADECAERIDDFIEDYENLSQLKRTIRRFNDNEFWKNPGYGIDVAFSYGWIHELLEPVIKKYEIALAADVYKHNIMNVKKCGLQVLEIQKQVAALYGELNEYYKTEAGAEELSRCAILRFDPLETLYKLSSNDFEMENGRLSVVENKDFYGDIKFEDEKENKEEYGRE